MLVSKNVQAFKNLKSQKSKCHVCGPSKLNLCHRHFSFQALECSFATNFRRNKKTLYFNKSYFLLQKLNLRILIQVCSFQSMKSPMELNSLFLKFFCYTPGLIRRDTGRLANEAFTSNPIVSSE